jgi:hypothetical protein
MGRGMMPYSGRHGCRVGTRVMLHGRFTIDGSTLTIITDSKSAILWKGGFGKKESEVLNGYVATISPIDHLDEEKLILGEYLRQLGDETVPVALTATYFRTRRVPVV